MKSGLTAIKAERWTPAFGHPSNDRVVPDNARQLVDYRGANTADPRGNTGRRTFQEWSNRNRSGRSGNSAAIRYK
jgi:hypothetical protein